jgi:hypothetical protein
MKSDGSEIWPVAMFWSPTTTRKEIFICIRRRPTKPLAKPYDTGYHVRETSLASFSKWWLVRLDQAINLYERTYWKCVHR